jgi:hypothetical protein
MKKSWVRVCLGVALLFLGFGAGKFGNWITPARAAVTQGSVPESYGKLVAAIPDQIGTGLIFEASDGVIRFVSVNGMKEGELARYDDKPIHGGIPKSYGHLVAAVVNPTGTGLVFEDAKGVIRFVTLTGDLEAQLSRN